METILVSFIVVIILCIVAIFYIRKDEPEIEYPPEVFTPEPLMELVNKEFPKGYVIVKMPSVEHNFRLDIDIPSRYHHWNNNYRQGKRANLYQLLTNIKENKYKPTTDSFFMDVVNMVKHVEGNPKDLSHLTTFVKKVNELSANFFETHETHETRMGYRIFCFLLIRTIRSLDKKLVLECYKKIDHIEIGSKFTNFFTAYRNCLIRFLGGDTQSKDYHFDRYNFIHRNTDGLTIDYGYYKNNLLDYAYLDEHLFLLEHIAAFDSTFTINKMFKETLPIILHPSLPKTILPLIDEKNIESLNRVPIPIQLNPELGMEILPGIGYIRYFQRDKAFVLKDASRVSQPERSFTRNIITHNGKRVWDGYIQCATSYNVRVNKSFVFLYSNVGFFYQDCTFFHDSDSLHFKEIVIFNSTKIHIWRYFKQLSKHTFTHRFSNTPTPILSAPSVELTLSFDNKPQNHKGVSFIIEKPEDITSFIQTIIKDANLSHIKEVSFHEENDYMFLLDKKPNEPITTPKLAFNMKGRNVPQTVSLKLSTHPQKITVDLVSKHKQMHCVRKN